MTVIENLHEPRTDEVYLRNYKKFVKIDHVNYGGSQRWLFSEKYTSKFRADRSCGVVAASNIFQYMSKNNKKADNNQENHNISIENFLEYSMEIYKYIKPRIYGIPTVNVMKRGLKRYANSINHEIKTSELINSSNIWETIDFIKGAMEKDIPIMMITWNTKIKNLVYHWVTITGYYKTISGENFIITSNWGKKEVFSLDRWLESKSFYKGLLYFQILDKN